MFGRSALSSWGSLARRYPRTSRCEGTIWRNVRLVIGRERSLGQRNTIGIDDNDLYLGRSFLLGAIVYPAIQIPINNITLVNNIVTVDPEGEPVTIDIDNSVAMSLHQTLSTN